MRSRIIVLDLGEEFSEKVINSAFLVETLDLEKKVDLKEKMKIEILKKSVKSLEEIEKLSKKFSKSKIFNLIVSPYHFPTYYFFLASKLNNLVIFDAHADMKTKYEDEIVKKVKSFGLNENFNDATWLYKLLLKKKCKVWLFGVRSCSKLELKRLSKLNYFTPNSLRKVEIKNIYLSVDLDVFDPAFIPEVEYPEPLGLNLPQFSSLLSSFRKIRIADVCCYSPKINLKNSLFFLWKVIFEILYQVSLEQELPR